MKLQGSLACLLLALCLGSGAASPLQNGAEGTGAGSLQGVGDAISHGVGEAVGQGAKEAASSGIQDALSQGHGEEGGVALRGARGDAFDHRLGEAARSLGNTGNEVGRQAEDVIRRGIDAAHNSGSWGTSGGHGMFGSQGGVGSQGNPGAQGTPWASEGNYGTNSLGGSAGQGGNGRSFSYETNGQGAVAQPGYGSVRGSNPNSGCTNPPPSGSHGSSSSSGGGGSGGDHGGSSGGGSHGQGSSGHGSSSSSSSGQGHSGSSSSGSRDRETASFDEGYSVSRGSGSGGDRGGSSSGSSGSGDRGSSSGDRGSSGGGSGGRGGSSGGSGSGSGGGNRPECDNPGNDVRVAGGSGSQESRENSRLLGGSHDYQEHGSSGDSGENEAVSELKSVNYDAPSLPFDLDGFWENLKAKLRFINWDAINKGRLQPPSTRALLYFRRLWENFKRSTPFFNWKQIEGSDVASLQKRAGGASDQFSQPEAARQEVSAVTAKNYHNSPQENPTYNWQYYAKTTPKGGVVPSSSSASRAQPGLLKWMKFW